MARTIHADGRGNDAIYDSDTGAFVGFPSVAGDPNSPPSQVLIPEAQTQGPYAGGAQPNFGDRTLGGKLGDPSMLRPTPPTGNDIPLNTGNGPTMNGGIGGPNLAAAGSNPDRYKLLQMHLGALGQQAYRPELAQSQTNALQNRLSAYGPLNQVMGSMYGPGATMDFQKMGQSPLTKLQMGIGAPNRNDLGLQNPYNQFQGPSGIQASANAPVTYPDASITLPPPGGGAGAGAPPAGLRRGPDGKLYDAQGRPVGG